MADGPDAQPVAVTEAPSDYDGGQRRCDAKDRPGKAEQLRVVHHLACESGQERGR